MEVHTACVVDQIYVKRVEQPKTRTTEMPGNIYKHKGLIKVISAWTALSQKNFFRASSEPKEPPQPARMCRAGRACVPASLLPGAPAAVAGARAAVPGAKAAAAGASSAGTGALAAEISDGAGEPTRVRGDSGRCCPQ